MSSIISFSIFFDEQSKAWFAFLLFLAVAFSKAQLKMDAMEKRDVGLHYILYYLLEKSIVSSQINRMNFKLIKLLRYSSYLAF